MTRDEWLTAFADAAGVRTPDDGEIEAILELAGLAAHATERTAAPVTAWLAASAGLTPAAALELARSIG
jgi:hypothetical protein